MMFSLHELLGRSPLLRDSSNDARGVAFMCVAAFWFSLMAFFVRMVSPDLGPAELTFVRNGVALLLFVPWLARRGIRPCMPAKPSLYLWRSATGLAATFGFFYSLQRLPLPLVISLTFTVPLITALLASAMLGERIGIRRWTALSIGFAGALVVLGPNADGANPAVAVTLATACFWALSGVLVKKLAAQDAPQVVAFAMFLVMTPLCLPFVLWSGWVPISGLDMAYIVLLAFCSAQGQTALSASYAHAEMGTVLPFDFLRLVFSGLLAYAFLGEPVTSSMVAGTALILAGSVYSTRRGLAEEQKGESGGPEQDAVDGEGREAVARDEPQ
jgi:drug/metabolite transporter (DMT)-like permease